MAGETMTRITSEADYMPEGYDELVLALNGVKEALYAVISRDGPIRLNEITDKITGATARDQAAPEERWKVVVTESAHRSLRSDGRIVPVENTNTFAQRYNMLLSQGSKFVVAVEPE